MGTVSLHFNIPLLGQLWIVSNICTCGFLKSILANASGVNDIFSLRFHGNIFLGFKIFSMNSCSWWHTKGQNNIQEHPASPLCPKPRGHVWSECVCDIWHCPMLWAEEKQTSDRTHQLLVSEARSWPPALQTQHTEWQWALSCHEYTW